MSETFRVAEIFVPGRLPEHTYNPRSERELEQQVSDYLEEAGTILTVSGPTKTGKSVLLKRVVGPCAWVDGAGIADVDELWRRIGDALSVYTNIERSATEGSTGSGEFGSEAGFGPIVKVAAKATYAATDASSSTVSVERPLGAVVRDSLTSTVTPLVVDDFHFIERAVQRDVVRAIKPLVLAGVPIAFISISHRAQDVVTAEPDMTGRVSSVDVDFWNEEELLVIPTKGFALLNIIDDGGRIAHRLAQESYGSPHLMQKFCREVCKADGIRQTLDYPRVLATPDWESFFAAQIDDASADWFARLLKGPAKGGKARTMWDLKDGRIVDGYGLTLAAIASTGPKLSLSKDEIRTAVDALVNGPTPALHQTTRVLQHMSNIAAKRSSESVPTEEEMDQQLASEPQTMPDVQPVLEYMEQGPTSALHIADPFFAFYLRWGTEKHLPSSGTPSLPIDESTESSSP